MIYRRPTGAHHFTEDILKFNFFYEMILILIQIELKFVFKCPFNSKVWLVQTMAWCQTGDKPSSEQMLHKFYDIIWPHNDQIMRHHMAT